MISSKQRVYVCMTLAAFVTIKILHIGYFNLKVKTICEKQVSRETSQEAYNVDARPLIVMGILTSDVKRIFRDAQRETWISSALHNDINFRFVYKFVIDEPTNATEAENKIYNDIIYLNITTHGYAVKFGEKNYVWFKYVHEHYPDALLGARVDDDVYLCVPQIFDRLSFVQSHTLHYGWGHSLYDGRKVMNIDEMFIVLGDVLMKRIAERKYCYSANDSSCNLLDMRFGGEAIREWLHVYDDVESVADNQFMIHFSRTETHKYASYVNKEFCNRWALYHKASPAIIRKFHEFQTASATDGSVGSVTGALFPGSIIRNVPQMNKQEKTIISKDDMVSCDNWAVLTTIFDPSEAVIIVANTPKWCLVIVGDMHSAEKAMYMKSLPRQRVIYLSIQDQNILYPELSRRIPLNSIGRKNIGYIYAIHHGAKYIWDFDDDNLGTFNITDFKDKTHFATACKEFGESKLNPYPYFGVKHIYTWPRGFPLQHIKNNKTVPKICAFNESITVGVIQSLANIQPDVDAIYRLTREMPFNFTAKKDTAPLVIPARVYTPFNAQATVWYQSAFAFMPLPVSVHGRVSDIWRSYIAQFFMHKMDIRLVFTTPYVIQIRNKHSDIKDLNAEKDLYEKSDQLVGFLSSTEAKSITNLTGMYEELYRRKYLELNDLEFIRAWTQTYNEIVKH